MVLPKMENKREGHEGLPLPLAAGTNLRFDNPHALRIMK
jgi:hypothetical protein